MSAARILLVDDNLTNLKLISTTLKFAGHTVVTAENAEVAQDLLRDPVYDLILMDIALPGMDGLTLTRKLKEDERTKHIPIVVLTAFAMKGDDQKAFDAGCNGYITKPINTRLFSQQIAEYLPKQDQPDNLSTT